MTIKNKFKEIVHKRFQGAVIRAKAKYILGEKSTSYLLGLEKQKENKMYINELVTKDNKVINNITEILDELHNYYKNLFKRDIIDIKDS